MAGILTSTGWSFSSTEEMFLLGLTLVFNPIKLVLLIGWIYLCLYCVQRGQFSPLVPKEKRAVVNIITLLTGPVLLIILQAVHFFKRCAEDSSNISEMLQIIKTQLRNASVSIRSMSFLNYKGQPTINLMDSAGRDIKEIYGQAKGKRKDNKIINLTEQIIWNALEEKASDILIDPKDDSLYTVRLRIDGILRIVDQLETETCKGIINSVKAVSRMDISEKRRPQDGAFVAKTEDGTASFRVASAGVLNGEKLSIRILNKDACRTKVSDIGLSGKQLTLIRESVNKPSGMILICGPTGSGKTTTMYAMLNEIDRNTRNLITIEDPIESILSNASQIEINPKADITFSKSLRSILRQDPDVICVGEIRDEETAAIALRAAQTGHLVLATLHSNSNAGALIRLIDLGISPMLISSGLSLIISQRLARRLCEGCKTKARLNGKQIQFFRKNRIDPTNIFRAVGCEDCYNSGYRGRIAICDVLPFSSQLRDNLVNNQMLIDEMRKSGTKKGTSNLYKQGLKKVVTGTISISELKRVIG